MSYVMSKTTVQARVPRELKQNAEIILSDMGMTISDGIRLFLYQTVAENQIPSKPKLRKLSKEFMNAIKELDSGKAESFESIDDLVASWK